MLVVPYSSERRGCLTLASQRAGLSICCQSRHSMPFFSIPCMCRAPQQINIGATMTLGLSQFAYNCSCMCFSQVILGQKVDPLLEQSVRFKQKNMLAHDLLFLEERGERL